MTVGYRLASRAEADLWETLERIALRDGVDRAQGVMARFFRAFESLAVMPRAGSTRPVLTGDRVRWHVVGGWIVLYEEDDDGVMILRVLHGAQDLDRILGDDD